MARTYSDDVTLLTLGNTMEMDAEKREAASGGAEQVVEEPGHGAGGRGGRIAALRVAAERAPLRHPLFGARPGHRTGLAEALGAEQEAKARWRGCRNDDDGAGALCRGGMVAGLDQIVVAWAMRPSRRPRIHNRCELPTEDEPDGAGRARPA